MVVFRELDIQTSDALLVVLKQFLVVETSPNTSTILPEIGVSSVFHLSISLMDMDYQNGFVQGTPEYYYSFLKNFKLGTVYYSDDVVPPGVQCFPYDGMDYWSIVTVPVEVPIQFFHLPRPVSNEEEEYRPTSPIYEMMPEIQELLDQAGPSAQPAPEAHPIVDILPEVEKQNGEIQPKGGSRRGNPRKRPVDPPTDERNKVVKPRGRPPTQPRRDTRSQHPPEEKDSQRKEVRFTDFHVEYHRNTADVMNKMEASLSTPNTAPFAFKPQPQKPTQQLLKNGPYFLL